MDRQINNQFIEKVKRDLDIKASAANVIIVAAKSALIVVDMINDGLREGGAFHAMGYDITRFQSIEPNIIRLVDVFKKHSIPIVYVTSYYDSKYLPSPMRKKFKEMGIEGSPFARKGTWGTEFIDTLPRINDYRVIKSHFSPFAEGFSLVLKEGLNYQLEEYLKLTANEDEEINKRGGPVLTDFYLKASANTAELSVKGSYSPLKTMPDFMPLTLGSLFHKVLGEIDTLICVGGSTHVCLASTIYSASERSYEVMLPIDAIASEDENKHIVYLHNFSMFNSTLCTTSALVDNIEKQ